MDGEASESNLRYRAKNSFSLLCPFEKNLLSNCLSRSPCYVPAWRSKANRRHRKVSTLSPWRTNMMQSRFLVFEGFQTYSKIMFFKYSIHLLINENFFVILLYPRIWCPWKMSFLTAFHKLACKDDHSKKRFKNLYASISIPERSIDTKLIWWGNYRWSERHCSPDRPFSHSHKLVVRLHI